MKLALPAVIVLFILCSFVGSRRGLIKSVLSTIGIVGSIILANILNPYVTDFLNEHTGLREAVQIRVETTLGVDRLEEQMSVYDKELYLENVDIPEMVKNYIRSGGSHTGMTYIDYVVGYLTDMVMRGVAYVLTFIITLVIVLIALALSQILAGVPIVRGIDRFGGFVFGAAQAVLIVWGLMLIITVLSVFPWALGIMREIEDSSLLSLLYEKNIFLKIVEGILGNI